jgi:hypothetical protein
MHRVFLLLCAVIFGSAANAEDTRGDVNTLPTLNSSGKIYTFKATTIGQSSEGWVEGQITLVPGDVVSFNLHYNLSSDLTDGFAAADDVKFFFPNLDGTELKADDQMSVFGVITAKNYPPEMGYLTINTKEDVVFFLRGIGWQKAGCQKWNCREPQTTDLRDAINGKGYDIGDIQGSFGEYDSSLGEHYTGNVVLSYDVCPPEYLPDNGAVEKYHDSCAASSRSQIFGTLPCRAVSASKGLTRMCFELSQQTYIAQLGLILSIIGMPTMGAFWIRARSRRRSKGPEDDSKP